MLTVQVQLSVDGLPSALWRRKEVHQLGYELTYNMQSSSSQPWCHCFLSIWHICNTCFQSRGEVNIPALHWNGHEQLLEKVLRLRDWFRKVTRTCGWLWSNTTSAVFLLKHINSLRKNASLLSCSCVFLRVCCRAEQHLGHILNRFMSCNLRLNHVISMTFGKHIHLIDNLRTKDLILITFSIYVHFCIWFAYSQHGYFMLLHEYNLRNTV